MSIRTFLIIRIQLIQFRLYKVPCFGPRRLTETLTGAVARHSAGHRGLSRPPMHDLDLRNEPRSNVSMPFESPYVTSFLMVIVDCTTSVGVCEVISYELQIC